QTGILLAKCPQCRHVRNGGISGWSQSLAGEHFAAICPLRTPPSKSAPRHIRATCSEMLGRTLEGFCGLAGVAICGPKRRFLAVFWKVLARKSLNSGVERVMGIEPT
ncbi:MAG: hypothetical protein KDL87_20250, partial [Verrucomicrobiae bacterium]|nr:hypothetical protein [Verrucomicrobiae bacterium]